MAAPASARTRSPCLYIGVYPPVDPRTPPPPVQYYLEIRKGHIIADARLFNSTRFNYYAENEDMRNEGMRILAIKIIDIFSESRFQNIQHDVPHRFNKACSEANLAFEKFRKDNRRVEGGPVTLKLLNEEDAKRARATLNYINVINEMNEGHTEIENERQVALWHQTSIITVDELMKEQVEIVAQQFGQLEKIMAAMADRQAKISSAPQKMEIAFRLRAAIAKCNQKINDAKTVINEINSKLS